MFGDNIKKGILQKIVVNVSIRIRQASGCAKGLNDESLGLQEARK